MKALAFITIWIVVGTLIILGMVAYMPKAAKTKTEAVQSIPKITAGRAMVNVERMLKDGSSAKYRGIIEATQAVCGEVNSKNSFGGYTGYQGFVAGPSGVVYLEEQLDPLVFVAVWNEACCN